MLYALVGSTQLEVFRERPADSDRCERVREMQSGAEVLCFWLSPPRDPRPVTYGYI
jgi:hypothetical protein